MNNNAIGRDLGDRYPFDALTTGGTVNFQPEPPIASDWAPARRRGGSLI